MILQGEPYHGPLGASLRLAEQIVGGGGGQNRFQAYSEGGA